MGLLTFSACVVVFAALFLFLGGALGLKLARGYGFPVGSPKETFWDGLLETADALFAIAYVNLDQQREYRNRGMLLGVVLGAITGLFVWLVFPLLTYLTVGGLVLVVVGSCLLHLAKKALGLLSATLPLIELLSNLKLIVVASENAAAVPATSKSASSATSAASGSST